MKRGQRERIFALFMEKESKRRKSGILFRVNMLPIVFGSAFLIEDCQCLI